MATEYKYRGRDAKDVKQRAEQQGGSWDRITDSAIPAIRIAKSHTLRIMQPPDDIDEAKWGRNWSIAIYVHYNIGTDKGMYLCLQKMDKGDCPICEARAQQDLQQGDPDPFKPTLRYLCYVIDRDNERDGPQLWNLPWTVEREIQSLSLDAREGVLAIDHPDEGFDVSFSREGKGVQTKWVGVKLARKPTPLSENIKTQNAWLQFINENPLPDTLHYESYEYIDKVFRAQTPKRDDERASRRGRDDDEDDADRREHKRPARSAPDQEDGARRSVAKGVRGAAREEAREERSERSNRRSREEPEEREDEEEETEEAEAVPAAKTRSEIARERVNRLKQDDTKGNGKQRAADKEEEDPEDSEEEQENDDVDKEAPRRSSSRDKPREAGRPRSRRDRDDDAPY